MSVRGARRAIRIGARLGPSYDPSMYTFVGEVYRFPDEDWRLIFDLYWGSRWPFPENHKSFSLDKSASIRQAWHTLYSEWRDYAQGFVLQGYKFEA